MALDRSWYNSLVNDDGSGKTGTIWRKEDVGALMSAVDEEILRLDTEIGISKVKYLTGVSGVVNDLELPPSTSLVVVRNTLPLTITGMGGGVPGQTVTLVAAGDGVVSLTNRDIRSLEGNQLLNTVTSGPTPLAPQYGRAQYVYDAQAGINLWRLVSHVQGQALQVPYDPANFTANNGATWTVSPDAAADYAYLITGKTLAVNVWVNSLAPGGSTLTAGASVVGIRLPNGYRFARTQRSPSAIFWRSPTVTGVCLCASNPNGTDLSFTQDVNNPPTVWPAGLLGVVGALFFELV